ESSGEGDGEGAAGGGARLQLDGAAVRFGDPLDDRQAETEAALGAGAGAVGAEEAFEDMRHGVGRDADAGVGDAEADAVGGGVERGGDAAAAGGVADRVIEQVDDQPAQQLLVAGERNVAAGAAFESDAAGGGEALDGAAGVGEQVVEIEIADLELDAAGVGAGEVQEIVDETGEAARFVEDDGEGF